MDDEKRKHEAEVKAEQKGHAHEGEPGHDAGNADDDVEGYGEKGTDPPDASGGT